jgi:hypothetical protein
LRKNAGSGSGYGSVLNQSGSTTLKYTVDTGMPLNVIWTKKYKRYLSDVLIPLEFIS